MAPSIVHLPNGQNITVTPIFGGLYFKSNELSGHHGTIPFPPGWTVVLNSREDEIEEEPRSSDNTPEEGMTPIRETAKRHLIHPYHRPTLQNDHLFISSISQPPSNEFIPATSPTRQIAMMLWATLYWYFHQPEPDFHLSTKKSEKTPDSGKPKGEWKIWIAREGVFKSRVTLPKLERMGLIASEDSSVGADQDERAGEGWLEMFVSRKAFWQLDARIYLFTLSPAPGSPYANNTPVSSRPGSPNRQGEERMDHHATAASSQFPGSHSPGPFHSSSHLPTYYPPPPPQMIMTHGVSHPLRPKPGKQGEVIYTRFIPSLGQFLSFRIASTSANPVAHKGPVAAAPIVGNVRAATSDAILPTFAGVAVAAETSDAELLRRWMNEPRVADCWGEQGDRAHQERFLRRGLRSRHSVPVIGCWDGKPFGYFEIYWVKEDPLGRLLGNAENYDRGIHCLVGEQEFRGPHRVKVWLSALIHYCWMADNRTEVVMMEPRVDNEKILKYCLEAGFYKEREIGFPHKQANVMKVRRDAWAAPAL